MNATNLIRYTLACALACAGSIVPATVSAQQGQPARPGAGEQVSVRGFGDFAITRFAAADTFNATLGSASGTWFGGGLEVILPHGWLPNFFHIRVSHFAKSGERVFVDDGDVFPLGIDMDVAITPVEVSAGYRFPPRGRQRNWIPYVGGGIGWHRYSETSELAEPGEDVSETFTGFHALGGVEYRLGRWYGVAGEAQWTSVPDAIGEVPGSAGNAFDESNLGGIGFRVRFVIGR
jgi:hypothetical protein